MAKLQTLASLLLIVLCENVWDHWRLPQASVSQVFTFTSQPDEIAVHSKIFVFTICISPDPIKHPEWDSSLWPFWVL